MDSTLIQCQNKPSASKLPIKRKTPDPNPSPPDPIPDRIDGRAPPFKFHRIWTEPDEIRFLKGLLDCYSQNLAFPRDLGIFYARFSNTMSQPYTKSQLSEKLRRLRKKFRVISTRLSKGLDRSQLSTHDRALYDLSKRLWHLDYAATSPFSGARNVGLNHNRNINSNNNCGGACSSDGKLKKSSLVGIKVDFSPTLPVIMSGFDQEGDGIDAYLNLDSVDNENGVGGGAGFSDFRDEDNQNDEVKLSEVNVELEGEEEAMEFEDDEENDTFGEEIGAGHNSNFDCESEIGEVMAKVVMNVFDECFNDARTRVLADQGGEGVSTDSFEVRWQRQRIAELDVLRSRLGLVLEHSLRKD
ncbi:hypothetical protein PHJA_001820900 [Phtheirospermum japonicum]|uniref:Glabrous enhancer-binding protein-like DBD domain-containing protein n=1 Tax=Phtheirospermum japonicum TaxID=374723 RepID=A0A830CHY4_9LAMI|nr:hypothetical protein PHJA_001820900 [Phtheirospermum japonicum]